VIIVEFKGRLASKKFPEDKNVDKQLILNMCLYASDHSNPCKLSILYFKWLAAEMEEYYQQGDLERKLDFTISPFYDRTTCNPFKY
jgi:3'5'-cyclic nucleotide phosphodiesterase